MKLFVVFLMTFLITGCVTQGVSESVAVTESRSAFEYSQSILPPKLAKVIPMLKKGNFKYVEDYYTELLSEYEKNPTEEQDLYLALDLIKNTDQNIFSELDDYIEIYQQVGKRSYVAHLLRGVLYTGAGKRALGNKYGKDPSYEQIDFMENYYSLAYFDFDKAIKLNKNDVFARLYNITRLLNEEELKFEIDKHYSNALDINKLSFVARSFYMNSLQPKWGGSIEKMQDLVKEANKYQKQNKKLSSLNSWLQSQKAETYWETGEYDKSLQARIVAANSGEGFFSANQYHLVGNIYLNRGDYHRALSSYSKAIEVRPTDMLLIKRFLYTLDLLGDNKNPQCSDCMNSDTSIASS